MMERPDLRVSDADRHAAAEQLAGHAGAGRLSLDEFDHRVRAVWAARTHADLRWLFADLPQAAPASRAPRLELVAIVAAVLVAVLGLAVPAMAGTMPGCM